MGAAVAFASSGCDQTVEPSPVCLTAVSPAALSPCLIGGSVTATVSAPSTCRWSATSNSPWLTITGGASGTGAGIITLAFPSNYDAPREAVVTVMDSSGKAGHDLRVSQAGCFYGVTQNSFSFSSDGGSGRFDVIQQTVPTICGGPQQDACQWTAMSDAFWISVSTPMPRVGDDAVFFTVAPASGAASRTGTIVMRDQIVQVTQAGR